MNGAAKIKYGIYDRFAEGRRAKAPEHGGGNQSSIERGTEWGGSEG